MLHRIDRAKTVDQSRQRRDQAKPEIAVLEIVP
jgi:hypothetical protein